MTRDEAIEAAAREITYRANLRTIEPQRFTEAERKAWAPDFARAALDAIGWDRMFAPEYVSSMGDTILALERKVAGMQAVVDAAHKVRVAIRMHSAMGHPGDRRWPEEVELSTALDALANLHRNETDEARDGGDFDDR